MKCIICEGDLRGYDFSEGSPICRDCVSTMSRLYGVEYSPPQRHSRLGGYLSLIAAIRQTALIDSEIEDFEDYWLETPPWNHIMQSVQESILKAGNNNDTVSKVEEFVV